MTIEELADAALRWSPMHPAIDRWHDRHLRVLCYHGVSDAAAFRSQMQFLSERYRPVVLDEVLATIRRGRSFRPRSVLLTFDDGVASHIETVMPVLDDLGLQGTFFVTMGAVGSRVPFWWERILQLDGTLTPFTVEGRTFTSASALVTGLKSVPNRIRLRTLDMLNEWYGDPKPVRHLDYADIERLISSSHAVGNHSSSHPLLDQCTDEELADEIKASHDLYRSLCPDAPPVFAYPNGNHDDRVRRHLAQYGYLAGFLFNHRISSIADPLQISRLRVNELLSDQRFRILVSGLHSTILLARGRL